MPRRVDLPGADELFRPTSSRTTSGRRTRASVPAYDIATDAPAASEPEAPTPMSAAEAAPAASVEPTGRVKHDEKITVYVSSEELLALEQLRLTLRAQHGLAVDRGRIVRAAIAEALADVHARGGESALVQRLTQR